MTLSSVITVASPFGKTRTLLLTGEDAVTIGRAPGNSLAFPRDRGLSRFHCVIELDGDQAVVKHLSDKRPTLVNAKPVEDQRILRQGDVIQIGQVRIRYSLREINLDAAARRAASQAQSPAKPPEPRLPGTAPLPSDDPLPLSPEAPAAPESPRRGPSIDMTRQAIDEPSASHGKSRGDDEQLVQAAMSHARKLARLLGMMPEKDFDDLAIQLINARDQPVPVAVVTGAKEAVRNGREGVMFLRGLLLLAFRARATDLHVEPKRESFDVRLRIDGMMTNVLHMHPRIGRRLLRVIKVLSDIDIAASNLVQEGHFSAAVPGRHVDFRVSFTPTMHGQKLVLRVLDPANAPQQIGKLKLPAWMYTELQQVVQQNSGMVLTCGPTGSGKTSTLYALLRGIDRTTRNVVTIEDPIEYQLDNVTQLPINENQGNSFASLLRSVLRQDPDVLLVGEIRDHETARIAMQAAMTGHLVFSTVHAQDTVGAIYRLLDLQVEPYLVASSLQFVLAQRLVRVLCTRCRAATRPTAGQINRIGSQGLGNVTVIYHAVGCKHCLDTGYHGRRAVFELMHVNNELKDVIVRSGQIQDIRKLLRGGMFVSLAEAGHQLVAQGVTTLDEIDRVMGIS